GNALRGFLFASRGRCVKLMVEDATMSYMLPPDLQGLLQKHFALGHYATEEDVLREAFQALEEREAVREDIQQGLADWDAKDWRSLEEVDAELRRKHGIPRA